MSFYGNVVSPEWNVVHSRTHQAHHGVRPPTEHGGELDFIRSVDGSLVDGREVLRLKQISGMKRTAIA